MIYLQDIKIIIPYFVVNRNYYYTYNHLINLWNKKYLTLHFKINYYKIVHMKSLIIKHNNNWINLYKMYRL